MTVRDYLKLEQAAADPQRGSPVALLYVRAAYRSFEYANAALEERNQRIRRLLLAEIESLRNIMPDQDRILFIEATDMSLMILMTFQKTFPCG